MGSLVSSVSKNLASGRSSDEITQVHEWTPHGHMSSWWQKLLLLSFHGATDVSSHGRSNSENHLDLGKGKDAVLWRTSSDEEDASDDDDDGNNFVVLDCFMGLPTNRNQSTSGLSRPPDMLLSTSSFSTPSSTSQTQRNNYLKLFSAHDRDRGRKQQCQEEQFSHSLVVSWNDNFIDEGAYTSDLSAISNSPSPTGYSRVTMGHTPPNYTSSKKGVAGHFQIPSKGGGNLRKVHAISGLNDMMKASYSTAITNKNDDTTFPGHSNAMLMPASSAAVACPPRPEGLREDWETEDAKARESLYSRATWRMYHRITSARNARPIPASVQAMTSRSGFEGKRMYNDVNTVENNGIICTNAPLPGGIGCPPDSPEDHNRIFALSLDEK
mmetsp:Transcript_28821/g.44805  ORF Transcript_28821/g.44805 Transcript_28821/m.44805 type:complete len:383 (+) Transcript_28821:77-1225(+)